MDSVERVFPSIPSKPSQHMIWRVCSGCLWHRAAYLVIGLWFLAERHTAPGRAFSSFVRRQRLLLACILTWLPPMLFSHLDVGA